MKKTNQTKRVRKPQRKTMSRYFPYFLTTSTAAGLLGYLFFGAQTHYDTAPLFDTMLAKRDITTASIPTIAMNKLELEEKAANPANAGKTPLQLAEDYLQQNKETLKLRPYHELRAVEFKNPLGTRVKYSVFQDGIPVIGLGLEIQVSPKGTVSLVDNAYRPVPRASISDDKVLTHLAVMAMHQDRYLPLEGSTTTPESSTFLFVKDGTSDPELSYVISMREKGQSKRQLQLVFRASDGQVLAKHYARSEF